jgi:hypothetical protein
MGEPSGSDARTAADEGWAANERDRRLVGADATPAERLAWLEEAIELAYRTGALPRPGPEAAEQDGTSSA